MKLTEIPVLIGSADTEGLNSALNVVVQEDDTAKGLAALLEENPRGVIRRAIRLNRYQNATLAEMSDEEVQALVKPVVAALRGPDVLKARINLTEQITTGHSIKVRCRIEIEF